MVKENKQSIDVPFIFVYIFHIVECLLSKDPASTIGHCCCVTLWRGIEELVLRMWSHEEGQNYGSETCVSMKV